MRLMSVDGYCEAIISKPERKFICNQSERSDGVYWPIRGLDKCFIEQNCFIETIIELLVSTEAITLTQYFSFF